MRHSQIREQRVEDYGGYTRHRCIEGVLDTDAIARARTVFLGYQADGVITEGDFESDIWKLTDEVRNHRFDFTIGEEAYRKGSGLWSGLAYEEFKERMKAYIVLRMGIYALETLLAAVSCIRKIAVVDLEGLEKMPSGEFSPQSVEFLGMICGQGGTVDDAAEMAEEKYSSIRFEKAGPRKLAGFSDYFIFDREQKKYWEGAGDMEKTEAFPVWFWWNLTAILPLRPTEFLTMPWDCLSEDGNGHILAVRRTSQKKGVHDYRYHVKDDYELYRYCITERLAREVVWYKGKTELFREAGDWSLFLPSHKNGLGYMTYGELRQGLGKFLRKIGQPGLSIRLGDTRHLAMISLILSGGSPEVCRELAGHEDIDISSNYYANISTLIESAVYDQSRYAGTMAMFEGMAAAPPVWTEGSVKIEGGRCSFPAVWDGDVSECLKNYRERGRLGACVDCIHYHAEGSSLALKIREKHREDVTEDAAFLIRVVDAVRHGIGQEEDIDAAIARLQSSGHMYADSLWREIREGRYGKA